jgi:hypothetical protein
MKRKVSLDESIEAQAQSFAENLDVSVEFLKNTKISLYDIIATSEDPEALSIFNNAKGAFRAAVFYVVKALIKKLNQH